jgi:putative transposase
VVATARTFLLSVPTVLSWRKDVATKQTHLVRPKAPMNRLPDLVAEIARRLKREWPRWGTRRIAGVLARLGLKASRTSVQGFLRRPGRSAPAAAVRALRPARGPLVAKRPGHLWLVDFTRVGGWFRSVFVGAVIDGFSRKVLALRVVAREPTAAFAVRLLREAVAAHGAAPTWMVTDQGTQLTAAEFTRALRRQGIRRRFGAVGRSGSIALIERFWKSLKVEFAGRLVLYRPLPAIDARLRAYVRWFNAERPHQGLGQRTPDEVHFARDTRATAVPLLAALAVAHVEGERDLPVLTLRRAA